MNPLEYRKRQKENLYPNATMNHHIIDPENPELVMMHLHKLIGNQEKGDKGNIVLEELRSALNYVDFLLNDPEIERKELCFSESEKNFSIKTSENNTIITIAKK